MKIMQIGFLGLGIVPMIVLLGHSAPVAEKPPDIATIARPLAGYTQIIFHGTSGPFSIQSRGSLDDSAPWSDMPDAFVTELQPGVFLGQFPNGLDDIGFYRVVSESSGFVDLKGWNVLLRVSPPANGNFFVAGESPVVTVTILDTFAQGLSRSDFSTLSLYMYGPQDPQKTVTAVKLLNATADRTKTPHHYIDLKTNPDVKANRNILTYHLNPVTDELPGTYTVSLWSVLASDGIQQVIKFANVQIGNGTIETPSVEKTRCAACHEGTISGKIYMHHIDPGVSPTGNWSLDFQPVESCKSCHNNDGYAAYVDASAPGGRVSDPIVRRVHGVHMGNALKLAFNTNSANGDFKDYTHVEFPADVRNCTKCHVDDRWKTQPSRLACGTCHDNTSFGPAPAPAGMAAHLGGEQKDDTKCSACHAPESGFTSVTAAHNVDPPAFKQVVKLELTDPANGKFYAAGDAPKLTVKITDAATGMAIDPKTIVEPLIRTNVQANEWSRGNLFVSGPRAHTVPVLTTAAAKTDPNRFFANNDLRVRLSSADEDQRITRTADAIIYQLDDVAGLAPGTYTAFVEVAPQKPLGGWAYKIFQVGTTNIEPMVATNCRDCHENTTRHTDVFAVTFTPDICKNCHDYRNQNATIAGKTGWANANNGFGAAPLNRRVHGVHYGNYVDKPVEISAVATNFDFSHVILPMDVRNCTKCHSESTSWTEKPSRLACLACHDGDAAIAHANLMTFDPTPSGSWSGDEVESCEVCHGKGAAFSADVVHDISNPYVPPYPRAPREP